MIKTSLGEYTVHLNGSENGYLKTVYLGNKQAGFHLINNPLSRQLCALQSMCHELTELYEDLLYTYTEWMNSKKESHPYVNAYERTKPLHRLLRNLYISALIGYAKCFTRSDQGRKYRLQEKQIKKHYSKEELTTHRDILRLRNAWVAHGGASENEDAHVLLIQNPENNHLFLTVGVNIKHLPDSASLEKIKDATLKLLQLCIMLRNEKYEELDKMIEAQPAVLIKGDLQYELHVNSVPTGD
ncbi:hypothetical protein [Pseudomonas syringae]|uniref:Uncharacterized protein n=1 Tax=Pseudomonas syringae UB303 TaxID=1357287 RepID=A0AAJ4B1K8_PSESX|nr:hypothetical protein [Pseudomonas syringae]QHF08592.1 hypothetical protein N026_14410 [Pseudomonas syringae UB303]